MANILTDAQKQTLTGYARWAKFLCILNYISCGIIILAGIPLLLAFGLGLIYIAIGGLGIYMTLKLHKTVTITKGLASTAELSQEESTNKLLEAFENFRLLAKISGILNIISLVFGLFAVVAIIILAAASPNLFKDIEKDFDFENSIKDSSIESTKESSNTLDTDKETQQTQDEASQKYFDDLKKQIEQQNLNTTDNSN
jgi:hypothetical protein